MKQSPGQDASRRVPETDQVRPELPWYRVGIMWLVIGGPLAVIAAGVVTMVIAWTHVDPLVNGASAAKQQVITRPAQPTSPALDARNHAATPAR